MCDSTNNENSQETEELMQIADEILDMMALQEEITVLHEQGILNPI